MNNKQLAEYLGIEHVAIFEGTTIIYPLGFLYEESNKEYIITDIEKQATIYIHYWLYAVHIRYQHIDKTKAPIIIKQYLGMTLDELYNIIKSL